MSEKSNLSQNQKIKELLDEAEKRAKQIISEARAKAKEKLKSARVEADKEISAYSKKRDAYYKKYQENYEAGIAEDQKVIDKDVKSVLEMEEQCVNDRKPVVIDLLMDAVLDIKPRIHRNYRLRRRLDKTFGQEDKVHSFGERHQDLSRQTIHQHSPRVVLRQGLPNGSHSPRPQLNGLLNNRVPLTVSPAHKVPSSGGISTATHK